MFGSFKRTPSGERTGFFLNWVLLGFSLCTSGAVLLHFWCSSFSIIALLVQ